MPRGPRKYMCQNQRGSPGCYSAPLFGHQSRRSCKINLTASIYLVRLEIKTQLAMSVRSNRLELCLFPSEAEQAMC